MFQRFWLLLAFLFNLTAANAQFGSIEGLVHDESSQVLVGAQVQIQGTDLEGLTDLEGRFSFEQLQPGKYTLVITYITYAVETREIEVLAENKSTLLAQLVEEDWAEVGTEVAPAATTVPSNSAPLPLPQQQQESAKEAVPQRMFDLLPGQRRAQMATYQSAAAGLPFSLDLRLPQAPITRQPVTLPSGLPQGS